MHLFAERGLQLNVRTMSSGDEAPAPGQAAPAAPPAPVSIKYSGSCITEIKVLGKGTMNHYKLGTRGAGQGGGQKRRGHPADYKRKAGNMDAAMGVPVSGEGHCQRRLAELPFITLCWGPYGKGSSGVHLLVTLLATCRVRKLALPHTWAATLRDCTL